MLIKGSPILSASLLSSKTVKKMCKLKLIHKLIAVSLFFCSIAVMACKKDDDALKPAPELIVKETTLSNAKGQQFLSIKSESSWKIEVTYEKEGENWVKLNKTSGAGDDASVLLTVEENATANLRSAVLTVLSGSKYQDCKITQKGKAVIPNPDDPEQPEDPHNPEDPEPKPHPEPEPNPDPGQPEDPSLVPEKGVPGWLELPATNANDELKYYNHFVNEGGIRRRNYSYYWSSKDRVSYWVAYPLYDWYINPHVKRQNPFKLRDPHEPLNAPYIGRGTYKGSVRYDRGHQLPSADRHHSEEINNTTFYSTNMTPQVAYFNQGIWQKLEMKVRDWHRGADTTYVVTGCVIGPGHKWAKDNKGSDVAVPTAYFKALLRYKKLSDYGIAHYTAFATYLEHREDCEKGERFELSMSMSIDELEEKLGYDLFVNLPALVGEENAKKIEAMDPKKNPKWWR